MRNRNETALTAMRWARLPVGWPIGVFVYNPMCENEVLVLLTRVAFVPAVVLIRLYVWLRGGGGEVWGGFASL
jgi:hypothetical protein